MCIIPDIIFRYETSKRQMTRNIYKHLFVRYVTLTYLWYQTQRYPIRKITDFGVSLDLRIMRRLYPSAQRTSICNFSCVHTERQVLTLCIDPGPIFTLAWMLMLILGVNGVIAIQCIPFKCQCKCQR